MAAVPSGRPLQDIRVPPYKPPPIDTHPYYEIHDWDHHQPAEARDGGKFHRVWNTILQLPKYTSLTAAQRGVLHGIWAYHSQTALRFPRNPDVARTYLCLNRDKYLTKNLEVLERRGFLIPRVHQRRRDKSRGDKKNPPTPLRGARARSGPTYLPGFADWWSEYAEAIRPRPMRDKSKTHDEWKRIGLEDHAKAAIAKLKLQREHRNSAEGNGKFCPQLPDPIRYLKRRLWDEELRS